jgi:carbamoyl-phosphate synthase large subunit
MKKLNVLISSCGRRVQLIEAFRAEARTLGIDLSVLGCDVEPELSPATEFLDGCFRVPKCDSPDYIPSLQTIVRAHQIALIVPTIDPELPIMAGNREVFAAIGTDVVISGPEVIRISCNKMATAEWATRAGISTPCTCTLEEARTQPSRFPFPVIAKPIMGSGSVGVRKIESAAELYDGQLNDDFLVQEFVDGIEFTVNMYFDLREEKLRCVIPHRRLEVRGGEVSKGVTVRNPPLEEMAHRVAAALPGSRGCICFQAIQTAEGAISLIEINARFGGGFPLAYMAGAAFPRWIIEETLQIPSSTHNAWEDGVFMLRYDNAVFIK